jgi:MYXO-CTERM domain-containing protein
VFRRQLFAFAAVAAALVVEAQPAVAAQTVNLDQWASSDMAWQNGNLNGNNSRYPEGGIVPFRLAMEGMSLGTHALHINYDVTAGGHKAYDFLATWDRTNAAGQICAASGGAISTRCPNLGASSSFPFPTDMFQMDGLTVHGAELYSAAPRRLTIWGGTILSISTPVHSGPTSGNSSGDMLVRFQATNAAVELAWGGHLAQSAYWNRANGGASDGASMVSGSPWHMRTLQLDGSGNKNQDRSISPSAIVGELPPFALALPMPTPRPTAPPAPRATPIRTPTPARAPATPPPGRVGDPNTPASYAPVTMPPTSTAEAVVTGEGPTAVPAVVALLGVATLAAVPLLRRRRRP